jgi:stress response protein YsnF
MTRGHNSGCARGFGSNSETGWRHHATRDLCAGGAVHPTSFPPSGCAQSMGTQKMPVVLSWIRLPTVARRSRMVTSESDEVLAKHNFLRDCQSSLVTSANTFDLSLGVQGHGHGWQGSCSVLSDRSAYSSSCRTCVDGESTVELRTTRVLPVIPERLRMGRRRVTVGRVRITKTTSYRDGVVDELVAREEVHVRRVPVGRFVDGPVADRYVNGRLIVSILEEVPVVVRRLRVVEGLHIERHRQMVRRPQRVAVGREDQPLSGSQRFRSLATARPTGPAGGTEVGMRKTVVGTFDSGRGTGPRQEKETGSGY